MSAQSLPHKSYDIVIVGGATMGTSAAWFLSDDKDAIMGPHPDIENFFFLNGFSGHGLQQSPAMGRGTAEIMVQGRYTSLDMSQFHFERIPAGRKIIEKP